MRLQPAGLGMVVVALLLAGCAPAEQGTSPSAEPSNATSSVPPSVQEPAPQETAPADPASDPEAPDVSEWVISTQGIGPVLVGMPFGEAISSLPDAAENTVELCSTAVAWSSPGQPGELVIVRPSETDDTGPVVEVAWRVDGIPSGPSGPRTEEGLGAGSLAGDVLAAHPDARTTDRDSRVLLRFGQTYFGHPDGSDVIDAVGVSMSDAVGSDLCG